MGLIIGIMMGTVFGVAIMAGWRQMMTYRSGKRIAKAVVIKQLGCLNRDDLRKICGDTFPEWISFPVYEQVKWLNKILGKLWPYVEEAARIIIKESVEPLLEDYRPTGITSLKFDKLSLGTVAPKIEGIRVQSLKKGQITMDIDFRWGGDPNIVLEVEAVVAKLPIQLKDLQVFTVIRVIFQLCEEIPCISAVVVALLSEPEPKIDYTLKAVGGSLTAIPGLSDMIDDTVKTIVKDMLEWPHRMVVPIVPTDTSDLELKPHGQLTLTIVKANNLKNMEMIGKSDPYVTAYIRPLEKFKTKVVNNNLNPVWNHVIQLIVEDKETQFAVLEVKYHHFTKEEQDAALEQEKKILEEKKRLKAEGLIGSTMDAIDGAAGLVGSGIGTGVGLVGSGVGAGVGLVGNGLGAVGSGLSKAGKFMGRTITGAGGSKRSGASTPVNSVDESGGAKPR
ncbi:synaptotagmin-5 isoform X2 [Helianthus annuus]|uniref:synaptotagmin-5 isoform X2 n=1 Tax=Helianthus annuus TaxID=4232 RepID=UPI0016530A53|nr:synaptotagmin-5 isoform X2 [Helianthus annuus]